ncbi:MAG: MFS transporter, partial [Planctomycetota bacterium]
MIARSYFLSADTRVGAGDVREMNRMETPRLSAGLNARLSIMMFLQYGIWGAWLPLLWPFLHGHRGFEPGQIGDMFAVGAVGALVAPFIAGQIADRYFST